MSFVQAYYPFFLYAIPYVIAAYVLIRAKRQRMYEARKAAIREFRIHEIAEAKKPKPVSVSRSITKMLEKIVTRRAA